MSRVWKIDDDGDLGLYVDGKRERSYIGNEQDRAEVRRILERGQADRDLPQGVHRAPDGTLLALGRSKPAGWERRFNPTREAWSDAPVPEQGLGMLWYEVRPVQPATERVPWHQSIGRRLPDGREIAGAWNDRGTPRVGVAAEGHGPITAIGAPDPDADGLVEVLVQP